MPLHIRELISLDVNKIFSNLHARAFSHATEELERVKLAVTNTVGGAGLTVTRSDGHHGNPIDIIEFTVEDEEGITAFFRRFDKTDLEDLRGSLARRVDEGCNLFVKVDKQSAFDGTIRLGKGDDVISVRVKIRAFPARTELAQRIAHEFLSQLIESKG